MADHSRIEWTQATWNPVTGCDKVVIAMGSSSQSGNAVVRDIFLKRSKEAYKSIGRERTVDAFVRQNRPRPRRLCSRRETHVRGLTFGPQAVDDRPWH